MRSKGSSTMLVLRRSLFVVAVSCCWVSAAFAQSTPSWAVGRTATGELRVDGGGSWGTITFSEEWGGYNGPLNQGKLTCPGAGDASCTTCNQVIWGSVFDNYLPGGYRDADVLFYNTNADAKHLLIKNVTVQNAWQCSGKAWSGPNGLSCPAGASDSNHMDVFQLWQGPAEDGGWVVIQDSIFRNSDDGQIFHWTEPDYKRGSYSSSTGGGKCSDPVGPAGIVLQSIKIEQTSSFAADCAARGNGADFPCRGNYWQISGGGQKETGWGYIWLINVDSSNGPKLRLEDDPGIVMIIGDQNKGGRNGWPSPLGPGNTSGPGANACVGRNGLLMKGGYDATNTSRFKIYCYDSIERALADTSCEDCPHPRPPFIQLSTAGWSSTVGGGPEPPQPPRNLRTGSE